MTSKQTTSKHAAVVGAGIMGRLLAWRLCRSGWRVSLYDTHAQDDQSSCSFAAAGMLSPFAEVETALHGIVAIGLASLPLWQSIWQTLPGAYARSLSGSLLLGHTQDASELKRFLGVLQQRFQGVDSEHAPFTALSSKGLERLEPALGGFSGQAVFFPQEGYVDPEGVMQALAQALHKENVAWFDNTCVASVQPGKVIVAGKKIDYDCVFDCRGLGAKSDFSGLRGVRGEALLLHAPGFQLNRPLRLLHPRYRCYLVPRGGDDYVLGASEIESEDMRPVSVRTLLELLSALYSILPELAEASVARTMVHCRPALPDNMPKMLCQPGLVAINGLYRHGFLLAPWLAESALRYLQGGGSDALSALVIEERGA